MARRAVPRLAVNGQRLLMGRQGLGVAALGLIHVPDVVKGVAFADPILQLAMNGQLPLIGRQRLRIEALGDVYGPDVAKSQRLPGRIFLLLVDR